MPDSGQEHSTPFKRPSSAGLVYDRYSSVEPGMIFCVEALVARNDGSECIKLEEQLLITESGSELLSRYPFEERLLSR